MNHVSRSRSRWRWRRRGRGGRRCEEAAMVPRHTGTHGTTRVRSYSGSPSRTHVRINTTVSACALACSLRRTLCTSCRRCSGHCAAANLCASLAPDRGLTCCFAARVAPRRLRPGSHNARYVACTGVEDGWRVPRARAVARGPGADGVCTKPCQDSTAAVQGTPPPPPRRRRGEFAPLQMGLQMLC